MHKHFGMVRYTRTGGEANAIAIRLARAAAGKDKVAIWGITDMIGIFQQI